MDSNASTSGVNPVGQPPNLNINKLVDSYVRLRDRKRNLEDDFKKRMQPYTKLMGEIEGQMMQYMHAQGVDSASTPGGTVYLSTTNRCTIKDGSAFRQWVVTNDQYELVDWRANANAVFDYIREHNGQQPPGVNPSTFTAVRFRSPLDKD